MPENKRELYSLIVNALTEGDSFIISKYNWVDKPYIGGLVSLRKTKRYYFSLKTYNQYETEEYEIHKYKGTVPVSDKRTDNI